MENKLVYTGKTKNVYALNNGNYLLKFKDDYSPVIARCSPFPLQRLRRSPTLGIGGRKGTWHP